jgi:predicted dehydrogenase
MINPDRPIRLAFLGCGAVTRKHSKTLRGFPEVKCYYASRTAENAEYFCREWKGSGFFASYEAAIASADIDVIFVATPPDSHLNLTLKSVEAGKHVIVEKPPFFHAADFDLIETARARTGVQVMVAENYFYKPILRILRQILQTDVIGDLKFMFFNATKTQKTGDWRDEAAQAGGGALFEGGIHWVNFMSNLGLSVRSVAGFQPSISRGSSLERSFQMVFSYEEGPVGTLLYSWEINTLFKGLRLSRIYGTQGSITMESNGVFIFVRGKKWRFILLPGLSDIVGSRAMFTDFFQALRTGKEPAFTMALAKRDLELIEAAYRSSK